MVWETVEYQIKGAAPLLMHNGQLVNPLNVWTKKIKEITSKRKKTDADFEEISHLEFHGGLYLNENGPILPADSIEATLINGAKKTKEGPMAKAGMFVPEHAELQYDGPRDAEKLWKEERFRFFRACRVATSKIMRMRPIFEDWSATIKVTYEDTVTSLPRVNEWVQTAGGQVGILDWRPKYGRFNVQQKGKEN